jgi:hypothetical protein
MSDESPRLSSLSVLGGPLHGKTLQLSRDLEEITIGSDPSCRFRLEIAGVAPVHARILADETGAVVFDVPGSRGLFLNFEKVEGRVVLHNGDMLRLGPPQDRDCVMVQLDFGGPLLERQPAIPPPSVNPPVAAPSMTTRRSSPSCRRPTTTRSSCRTSPNPRRRRRPPRESSNLRPWSQPLLMSKRLPSLSTSSSSRPKSKCRHHRHHRPLQRLALPNRLPQAERPVRQCRSTCPVTATSPCPPSIRTGRRPHPRRLPRRESSSRETRWRPRSMTLSTCLPFPTSLVHRRRPRRRGSA